MTEQTAATTRGHCLCGDCSFVLDGPPNWVAHCHCESCRRATASAFTTWVGQENERWRLTGAAPRIYESSPGQRRGFCGLCGTPMFYESDRYPNERHFYAALLERPDDVTPSLHYHADEMLGWVHLADGLPRR